MKKLLILLLILSLLSGCDLVDGSYYVAVKHSESETQAVATEEEEPTVVTDRNDLRAAVLYHTRNWIEQDVLLIENYDGDFNQDLSEVLNYAMQEDPIGAYAVDYIDVQLTGTTESGKLQVSIVFRRSAAEIDSIVTVNGVTNALQRIQLAISSYEASLTLRIQNYQEVDFETEIRKNCLENLNKVLVIPEFSAELYPHNGETRILELHFSYPYTREEMRVMLSTVKTVLTSSSSYINSGENDLERVELLARFLTTRFDYQIAQQMPQMPAYELLHDGLAHSLSFAAVFRYECVAAGIECHLVNGTKDEMPYAWNIVCIDDVYYHVDLMRRVMLEEETLSLLNSVQLRSEGYAWDEEAYPEVENEAVPEPSDGEQTQPAETSEQISLEPTEETTEPITEPIEGEEND